MTCINLLWGHDLASPDIRRESPFWQHVLELRAEANAILAFKMGDFFEFYQKDAVIVSAVLDIALTRRGFTADGRPIRLCGVPADARFNRGAASFGYSLTATSHYFGKIVGAGRALAVALPTKAVADLRPGEMLRRVIVARFDPGDVAGAGWSPNPVAQLALVRGRA